MSWYFKQLLYLCRFKEIILALRTHGQRSMAGCSPKVYTESDTTEATAYMVAKQLQKELT